MYFQSAAGPWVQWALYLYTCGWRWGSATPPSFNQWQRYTLYLNQWYGGTLPSYVSRDTQRNIQYFMNVLWRKHIEELGAATKSVCKPAAKTARLSTRNISVSLCQRKPNRHVVLVIIMFNLLLARLGKRSLTNTGKCRSISQCLQADGKTERTFRATD